MTTSNAKRAELRRQFREHNETRRAYGYAPILWAEWKPDLPVQVRLADAMKQVQS